MGRETVAAAGAVGAGIAAVGAGIVAAGLGAAYLANRYMVNQRLPQYDQPRRRQHRSQRRSTGNSSDPYMSIYMPTRTADLVLPMRRNGRTTNAFGYLHA